MLDTKLNEETEASEEALGLACAERVGALLEGAGTERDAELWAQRLAEKAARDDALNVAGMLAAAGAGGGARLADSLAAGGDAGARLRDRLTRYEELLRGAPDAVHARTGAARAEANARRLLQELETLMAWLDAETLETEPDLGTPAGRARALQAADALRTALKTQSVGVGGAAMRLAAVRERLKKLGRARERLAAALGRHLNNLLIHRGNEAASGEGRSHAHHAELLQYAPFMRWLKEMDEKTYDALVKVYVSTWSRVYEREVRAACESARAQLQATTTPPATPATDQPLDNVLSLVETICNAEQDFCAQFFFLDVDVKGEGSDGERSERSEGESGGGARRAGAEARRLQAELFPSLEAELVSLVQHMDKLDPYGSMRALACVGRRVLTGEGGAAGGALAATAVAAKRGADRAVAERAAALGDCVRAAARRPRCGLFTFLQEFEELSAACEAIFVGGRRADLERWYVTLAGAMLAAVASASHPRTPRAVIQLENYHRLHRVLSALRVPQLDSAKREAKARYTEALRAYVTSSFGQPLEKLQRFFEGVAEAVAGGARESEVCYRQAFSKHELRKVLALYPAHEVRKSLGRLYRTVEKQLSEEGGLLQVVWRAMQEEFIAQHHALQARIAACYPGAGLSLPLTIQDILDAFSDIAQEH